MQFANVWQKRKRNSIMGARRACMASRRTSGSEVALPVKQAWEYLFVG
jgi:hypothetical protein